MPNLALSLILSMPDGTRRETTFAEAAKLVADFPRRDETPAVEPDNEFDGEPELDTRPRFNP